MDKILELLKEANISETDLEGIKASFNEAVEARVKEEKQRLAEASNDFTEKEIEKRVNEQVTAYKTKLEKVAKAYCESEALTLAKKADKKVNEQMKKLEAATQKYIVEYFDKKFDEKYGEELQAIEDNCLQHLDEYLSYAITEKIDDKMIETTAVNETFEPIVKGIQNLFQEQFVPLNLSGKKKLKDAMAENLALQKSLKKSIDENMKLRTKAEELAKDKLVAEKTVGLNSTDAAKLKKMFESKSYKDTVDNIDDFRKFLEESVSDMRKENPLITERKKPVARRRVILKDDDTEDFVNEKFKKTEQDNFLTSVTQFL